MLIPSNIIINADDLGANKEVNEAILCCFKQGYINSTSLLTNTAFFEETVNLIHNSASIVNIGVHVDLAEGKPVSDFNINSYLTENGNWDLSKTNNIFNLLSKKVKSAFIVEIHAQIEKALSANISVVHLDSHYHLHTLPCFYKLFLNAARHYGLRLRLAQTYYEGSYIKLFYRKYINNLIKKQGVNYSDYFESVDHFLKSGTLNANENRLVEIMLHPSLDAAGNLSDHFHQPSMLNWIQFLTGKEQ